jgi:hypothetical protein
VGRRTVIGGRSAITRPRTQRWLAPTHAKEIRAGDGIFLWLTGAESGAGVIALAAVIAEAAEIEEHKPRYRMSGFENKYGPPRTRIRICVPRVG